MEETPFECPVLMRDKKQRHTVNGTVGENYFANVHVSSSSKKVTLDIVEQFTELYSRLHVTMIIEPLVNNKEACF